MNTAATDLLDYRQYPDNSELGHIPGDRGFPVLGRLPSLLKDYLGTMEDHFHRFGPVSRIRLSHMEGVLLLGPDLLQQVLLDQSRNFSSEMGYARTVGVFYRGGLLVRDFDEHRLHRRIMQSAFRNTTIQGYVPRMNRVLERHIASWDPKQKLFFFSAIKNALLDVASEIFLGMGNLDKKELLRLQQAFVAISEGSMGIINRAVPGTRFDRALKGRRYLGEYLGAMIEERRTGKGDDMFSLMCRERTEEGSFFSNEDVIAHLAFLWFAAHDTTTSALSHIIYYLKSRPLWQQRLYQESLSLGKQELDFADMDRLVQANWVFMESLRLHPSVPMLSRRSIRECELGGHRIPANTLLFMPPAFAHYMDAWWTRPLEFDPGRFSPERAEHKRHAFSYIPFGGGAHKCIGMHFARVNALCFLHLFLLRYHFEAAGSREHLSVLPLPKPTDRLPLRLHPRS